VELAAANWARDRADMRLFAKYRLVLVTLRTAE